MSARASRPGNHRHRSSNPRHAWRLYRLIKSRHVSIIHARSRAPAWAAYYAAKWAGIPFMTTFHGIYGTENFVKKYYNSVMAKGSRVIAVSQFVRDHIIEKYKITSFGSVATMLSMLLKSEPPASAGGTALQPKSPHGDSEIRPPAYAGGSDYDSIL